MIKLRFGLLSLLGILCAQFSANAALEGTLSCDPNFEYVVEDGTYYFENTSDCDGGTYCWYVDGVLQVIAYEWDWTPTEPGTYEICLNLLDGSCSTWYCEDVVVTPEDCSPCHMEVESHSCGDCIYIFSVDADFDADVTWLISDGTLTSGNIIMHTFEESGTYTICATATGEECPDGVSECFTVVADCGTEPTCEGGYILAQEIESCYTNFSVQGVDGITGIEWFVDGAYWGDGSVLPYFSYDDDTVLIEAFAFTEECPDGIAMNLSFAAEACGGGCDDDYFIWTEFESECALWLYAEGTDFENVAFNWYVDGEYVTSEWGLFLENEGEEFQVYEVLLEVWNEDCPEPYFSFQTITLGPCDGGCDGEWYIVAETTEDCITTLFLEGTNISSIEVEWFVDGSIWSTGPSLSLINTTYEDFLYQVEVVITIPGCDELFIITEIIEVPACFTPCEDYYIDFECWPGGYAAEFFIVGMGDDYPVEWYVGGEFWGTAYTLQLDVWDITFDIEAFVETAECPSGVYLSGTFDLSECISDCNNTFTIYEDTFDCTTLLHVVGTTEPEEVEWWVNGEWAGLSNPLVLEGSPDAWTTYWIEAIVYTENCPEAIFLNYTIEIPPCETGECIDIEIEVILSAALTIPEGLPWEVYIGDLFGATGLAEGIIELDPETNTGSINFCLPEGCYSASVYYPAGEWSAWIEDINLYGTDNQVTSYTGANDFIQFGLGTTCDFDTGFEEPLVALDAWPNPVSADLLNLKITGEVSVLEIRDLSGRVMEQISNPGRQMQISTAGYSNGLYMVTVQGRSGLASRKVQVQR